MSFLRWLRTSISPAEPCATVSQYSSTTSTHSPTSDANTNDISPDQCSAKLDFSQSLDNQAVADTEHHISEDNDDEHTTEPKRVQSPNAQLVDRKHIIQNNSNRRTANKRSVQERLRGTSERKVAIRNYFYSRPDYFKKPAFNLNFAKCFILERTEREVCQALNAEMIARRIKYDDLRYPRRISTDPELLSRDIMLALEVLKSSRTIETPQCTLSFMRRFGVSMMPCGLLGRCNDGEVRTTSTFFTDEPSSQSTLTVTMDEPAIDTNHKPIAIKSSTRSNITTIDSESDGEILTIVKPISQKRKSVIKETPVGEKAGKGYELRRKRILARNEIEKRDVNENESGSESENESIIVVESRRVIKTKDGSGDEDEMESVIKVENERVIKIEDDSEGQKERPIKIEDDSEREKEIYNKIEGEYDESESSVDEDLYKAKLELLSQVSNELSLLNSKKRKKQRKEDKDKSGSKRVKME
ncbi:uncharacterized protein EAE98_000649 [Botrytis deweyae]|uniref:Uncharacterized protein n=1 Tax=Botrytis deweyae TaxID=2478750 RepID=A0ABQ7J3L9_9HELO|nr:uncharacterized protein EAE98_000649 [Botrytis deweyae]KAF7940522.1 hypothetical protein EAE98_000649 [Botrytis deweyae]